MLSEELQQFLRKEFPYEARRMVFTPEMKLYKNFKMEGEDLDDFIIHFIERFNVKIAETFNYEERFYPEGISIMELIRNLFLGKKQEREERKDLSFAELDEAIKKWNFGVNTRICKTLLWHSFLQKAVKNIIL